MTTAHWDGDILFIAWYGGKPEESAYWRNGRLIFDGLDETFDRGYVEKPTSRDALNDIIRWQNNY